MAVLMLKVAPLPTHHDTNFELVASRPCTCLLAERVVLAARRAPQWGRCRG
jgi:hypothetical protein